MKKIVLLFRNQWRRYRANLALTMVLVGIGLGLSALWMVNNGESLGFLAILFLSVPVAFLPVVLSRPKAEMELSDRLLPVSGATAWRIEFLSGLSAATLVVGFAYGVTWAAGLLPGWEKMPLNIRTWSLAGFLLWGWLAIGGFIVAALVSFPTVGRIATGAIAMLAIATAVNVGIFEPVNFACGDMYLTAGLTVITIGVAAAVWAARHSAVRYDYRGTSGSWRFLLRGVLAALLFGALGAVGSNFIFRRLAAGEKTAIRQMLGLPEPRPVTPDSRRAVATLIADRSAFCGNPVLYREQLRNHPFLPFDFRIHDWNFGYRLCRHFVNTRNADDVQATLDTYKLWIADNENWFAECYWNLFMGMFIPGQLPEDRESALTLAQLKWEKFLELEPLYREANTDLEWFFQSEEGSFALRRAISHILRANFAPLACEDYRYARRLYFSLRDALATPDPQHPLLDAVNAPLKSFQHQAMQLYITRYRLAHDGQWPDLADTAQLPSVLQPPPGFHWKLRITGQSRYASLEREKPATSMEAKK